MLRNPRRTNVAASWQFARAQYAAVVAELAEVKRERDEFRAALIQLQAAVTARWEAEARLAELYRERAIARARAVERDPNAMLNCGSLSLCAKHLFRQCQKGVPKQFRPIRSL